MAAPAKKTPQKAIDKTVKPHEQSVRKRKVSRYKSFRLQNKIPHPAGPLPSSWKIVGMTNRLIWTNKKPLALLVCIYILLNFSLVRGFTSPLNVGEVKSQLSEYIGGSASKADTTFAIFSKLVTPDTQGSGSANIYQILLLIVLGLAIIWIFRQQASGNKPTARDALYKGMYPIVPLVLVILIMFLETLPAILGSGLYSATISSGVAVTGYEKGIWFLLSSLLILLSLYMLFSSLFALYIVTLPDMTPMKAVRSARHIVFSRRLSIFLRLLTIPLLFIILLLLIVVPAIYFATPFAPWIYFVLSIFAGLFVHAYLFTMYKELL